MTNQNIEFLKLENLELDTSNPRLPSKFRKQNLSQSDIVNWMLEDASIIELMLAIGNAGFFIGEALLVVNESNDKYTVIEGNRRLTSVKLLNQPEIAKIHKRKIEQVLVETKIRPQEIPCIIFKSREDINKYLGYRHVTGVKSWGVLQKARYLSHLKEEYSEETFAEICKALAKSIGSRSDHVRKLLVAYEIYQKIEDEGFYKIAGLDETTIFFNYYTDSLSRDSIRTFIGVDIKSESPLDNLNSTNLKELTRWFFEKNDQNRTRLLGDSNHLSMLDKVLANEEATNYFKNGSGSLIDAYQIVSVTSESYNHEIEMALSGLKRAQNIIHKVENHQNSETVKTKLKDISKLAKNMYLIVESQQGSEWDD
jgi:ribosomal protein S13